MSTKIVYRCMPKCIDNFCTQEFMEVAELMKCYAELSIHLYSKTYFLRASNLSKREHRDWNSFYELNIFLKECNLPGRLYIQGVLLESKDKQLSCPFPCQLIAREDLFISHIKRVQAQCIPYQVLNVSQSIVSLLVADAFSYKKLSLNFDTPNEIEIILTYNYLFSDYTLLTIPDICSILTTDETILKGVISDDRVEKLKILATHYKYYTKDYNNMCEAKQKVVEYIDTTLQKYGCKGNEIYALLQNIQQKYRK